MEGIRRQCILGNVTGNDLIPNIHVATGSKRWGGFCHDLRRDFFAITRWMKGIWGNVTVKDLTPSFASSFAHLLFRDNGLIKGLLAGLVLVLAFAPATGWTTENGRHGFSGQWHLELCDKSISEQCGGFTVYLVQVGKKICGDHFFATPGLGRLNEGAPRSVTGTVTGNIADIVIASGRNGAVFRVRAIAKSDVLKWAVIEMIEPGQDGDSALVLNKGNLKRVKEDSRYQATFSACQDR